MAWSDTFFGPKAVTQDFTKETLNALFDEIENDPRAGLGTLSKRERLIDLIVGQHRIVLAQVKGITPRQPAPAMNDRPVEVASPVQLQAAKAAKAAGM